MNRDGLRMMRWWKQHAPSAYDGLADPAAYFTALGELVEREVEDRVRCYLAGESGVSSATGAGEGPVLLPPEEVAPAVLPAHVVRDPRGDFVDAEGMPRRWHRLWQLLDDPAVSGEEFQAAWRAWLTVVPVVDRARLAEPDEGAWAVQSAVGPEVRPFLLLDIDGCLAPSAATGVRSDGGAAGGAVDVGIAARVVGLSDQYDLAWATTWEELAHLLAAELGWPMLPVVHVQTKRSLDPDGWDSRKIGPILDFVGDRPFAWCEDLVSRADAVRLTSARTCLVVRPDPAIGLQGAELEVLQRWAPAGNGPGIIRWDSASGLSPLEVG